MCRSAPARFSIKHVRMVFTCCAYTVYVFFHKNYPTISLWSFNTYHAGLKQLGRTLSHVQLFTCTGIAQFSIHWGFACDSYSSYCPFCLLLSVMMYKGLLAGYTYDESLTQSLVIPGMEAPPPIPPKKRKRRSVHSTEILLSYTSVHARRLIRIFLCFKQYCVQCSPVQRPFPVFSVLYTCSTTYVRHIKENKLVCMDCGFTVHIMSWSMMARFNLIFVYSSCVLLLGSEQPGGGSGTSHWTISRWVSSSQTRTPQQQCRRVIQVSVKCTVNRIPSKKLNTKYRIMVEVCPILERIFKKFNKQAAYTLYSHNHVRVVWRPLPKIVHDFVEDVKYIV